ncbi:hypothetical protein RvY_16616 [Ramazzottius varieornatus]|uniref:Uncharacterized protein n=1 Tax=Ramazzottius varieornatus TaxID=947166 RepID=A0A1D1W5G6_RAMVA|nr:hypothetical protein RvY_16616 [Ramazzottius varieornatus]
MVGYILLGMEGTDSKDPKKGTEDNYKNNAVHPIGMTNRSNHHGEVHGLFAFTKRNTVLNQKKY